MPGKCPVCGTMNAESAKRCSKCRLPLPADSQGAEVAVSRRSFLTAVSVMAGAGAAAVAVYAAYRFLTPKEPVEPPEVIILEPALSYPEGRTFVASVKAFIERQGNRLRCLSAVCTHLNCTVEWREPEQQYQCPCHKSSFSAEGQHVAGPAPRALPFLKLGVNRAGQLVLDRHGRAKSGEEWVVVSSLP